jgi:hypothetical protein
MNKLRIILATPLLIFSVLLKSIGLRVLPAYARRDAKELF